jgi:hypothetical protein
VDYHDRCVPSPEDDCEESSTMITGARDDRPRDERSCLHEPFLFPVRAWHPPQPMIVWPSAVACP